MISKKHLVVLISLMLALGLAACGTVIPAPAAKEAAQRSISASGTGVAYLVPDLAYISVGVQSRASEVGVALRENNAQAQAISKVLTGMGVEAKDIQTSAFNVYPQPQYGPTGEITQTDYVVDNVVIVTVRKLDRLGEMLDAVVSAGANNINSIQFDVTDKQAALADARKAAVQDAQNTAQQIAQAASVELGEILMVSTYTAGSPVPVFEGKGYGGVSAAADVPVSSGQLVLTVNADITYTIR
ncbi:MAG: SIMPL domain-containing protein [Anaerolineaceae bacterium]|nr:SIMPL domain-containing protein [Anaerolineaceae bacterium]